MKLGPKHFSIREELEFYYIGMLSNNAIDYARMSNDKIFQIINGKYLLPTNYYLLTII